MKSFPLRAYAVLTLLLVAGGGLAQTPKTAQLAERVTQADANGDGYLDRNEVANMPRLKRGFDKIDTDQDGRLSKAELQSVGQKLKQHQAAQ